LKTVRRTEKERIARKKEERGKAADEEV